jgi:uncharacterized membrane protein YbhN (UPF0104 family)
VTKSTRAPKVRGSIFLAAVVVFAWLGLRGRFGEVGQALLETPVSGVFTSLVLVMAGLLITGLLWLRLLASLNGQLPLADGLAIFFIGQLGKYLPGSVWSIASQADLARRHNITARVTVTGGLLFLGYHVATAVLIAAVAFLTDVVTSPWPDWVSLVGLVAALVGLVPKLIGTLAKQISGQEVQLRWKDTLVAVVLMALTWALYSAALVLLTPTPSWRDLAVLGAAFAAGYASGVMIVFAPAGFGAREAVFVVLLAPVLGVAGATALALLARVVHTTGDALMAAIWWWVARRASA